MINLNFRFPQWTVGAAVARLIPDMEIPEGHPFKSGTVHSFWPYEGTLHHVLGVLCICDTFWVCSVKKMS